MFTFEDMLETQLGFLYKNIDAIWSYEIAHNYEKENLYGTNDLFKIAAFFGFEEHTNSLEIQKIDFMNAFKEKLKTYNGAPGEVMNAYMSLQPAPRHWLIRWFMPKKRSEEIFERNLEYINRIEESVSAMQESRQNQLSADPAKKLEINTSNPAGLFRHEARNKTGANREPEVNLSEDKSFKR